MKRIIAFILFVLMVLGCCACQPTPKEPVVISKNDGKLEAGIYGTPAPQLTEPYSAPDTWTEALDGMDDYKLKINIDAKISTPKSLSYPVFRVEKSELSQDEADKIIQYFTNGETLYDYGDRMQSDAYYKALLKVCEDMLDNPDSILYTEYISDKGDPQGLYDACKGACEHGRETALNVLMMPKNGIEAVPTFEKAVLHRVNADMYIDGCSVYTYELDKNVFLANTEGGRKLTCTLNNMKTPSATRAFNPEREYLLPLDEAKQIADTAMRDMGYEKWNLVDISTQNIYTENFANYTYSGSGGSAWKSPAAYIITYTKDIYEDIPLLYYSNSDREYNDELSQENSYAPPLDFPPAVHLTITDEGVHCIIRCSDFKISGMINNNVPLLPFEKIQGIVRDKMFLSTNYSFSLYREQNPDGDFSHTEIDITDILLGYVQIREKYSGSTMLIPAWCLYGRQFDYLDREADYNPKTKTEHGFVFMCINAIDGSIIDLTQGY